MNTLPDSVQAAIDEMMQGVSANKLAAVREKLTAFYKEERVEAKGLNVLESLDEHLAYLAFRLPATYAALFEVFGRVKEYLPDNVIHSLVDIGAGPGTAFLAASYYFEELQEACLVERDAQFITLGKKLISALAIPCAVKWQEQDLKAYTSDSSFDLSVLSYSLGELSASLFEQLLITLVEKTKKLIVIVEPGTMHGYETIIRARTQLIAMGGKVIAPCPHQRACPIQKGDWCHFSCRLPRSRLHRAIKLGSLGYEDEKFSYLVVALQHIKQAPYDRIIRRAHHGSGFAKFTLCSHEGVLEQKTISRRDKESYALAKKAEWGDSLPVHSTEVES